MPVQLIPGRGFQKVVSAILSMAEIESLPSNIITLAQRTTDAVYIPDIFNITVHRQFADDYGNVNASGTFVIGSGQYTDITDIDGFAVVINNFNQIFTWGDDTIWHPTPDQIFSAVASSDDVDAAVGDLWFGYNNQGDGDLTGGTDGDTLRIIVPYWTYDRNRGLYV